MNRAALIFTGVLLVMACVIWGCERRSDTQESPTPPVELPEQLTNAVTKAIAVLAPTQDSQAHGFVTFTKMENGIKVVAEIQGLTPGKHGFHIHQFGDCSAADGTSAGGHFAPQGSPHGAPTNAGDKRHVGDLGNIEADAEGRAHLEWVDPQLSFQGRNSIVGRAVIIHAGEDDLTSQPTGNAGARVACGVIGIDE